MPTADVHPDLRRLNRVLPANPVSARTVPLIRAATRLLALRGGRGVETVRVSAHASVRVHRPARPVADPSPALLWIHGGGYVIGAAVQDDALCRRFANTLGITVASVDYRLAPQDPYPAAVHDCHAALEWLASAPGVDPDAIAIGGASAGGGLAAALAQHAHDTRQAHDPDGVAPVFQILVYPMLDDRTLHASDDAVRGHRLWSTRSNAYGWSAYLGDADRETAVPARRSDLRGLPPAWIGVGDNDLFHDEDLAYAERLTDAGVGVSTVVVPGAFHGFDALAPGSGVARDFFAAQCSALDTAFGRS